ncbi:MAG: PA2778 family cysteine peptidase [Deltaproteobacteria bacterium]|nr:PA2778 family cysteine peptidase [Deltaproteobacteria bacterium]
MFLWLPACAAGLGELRSEGLPPRAQVAGVPAFAQTRDHCGPAALASLLSWAGRPETPDTLGPFVYAPRRGGTLPIELAREIRSRGLLAYPVLPRLDALLAEVAAGHPALVLENRGLSWASLWHYSVLVGYDLAADRVTVLGGDAEPEAFSLTAFSHTWNRGGSLGLLALPAGELPAAADPEGILAALADLEEVGQAQGAALGYEAFLNRWPDRWRGAFGWGNALHALGQDDRAEAAFRRAHGTGPERPEPLNNLALLVRAKGRWDEAEALARRAVEAAARLGLDPGPYEQTLREVSSGAP